MATLRKRVENPEKTWALTPLVGFRPEWSAAQYMFKPHVALMWANDEILEKLISALAESNRITRHHSTSYPQNSL